MDCILTGVDELGLVAALQVMEDRSIIEVGQIDHVITLLKLGWIDLTDFRRFEGFFLKKLIIIFIDRWARMMLMINSLKFKLKQKSLTP